MIPPRVKNLANIMVNKMKEQLAIYIHGFASAGDNDRVDMLKSAGFKYAEAPTIPPNSSADFIKNLIKDICNKYNVFDTKDFIIIGTSQGGFYTKQLAKIFGVRFIVFNPVPYVEHMSEKYKDGTEFVNFKTGNKFILTNETFVGMMDLHIEANTVKTQSTGFVFLGTKDTLIPPSKVMRYFDYQSIQCKLVEEEHRIDCTNMLKYINSLNLD